MADTPLALRSWRFWLVTILWLAVAIPIALFSLFTQELPLWPSFSAESSREGIAVWVLFAAWFYVTPVVLFLVRRKPSRPKGDPATGRRNGR